MNKITTSIFALSILLSSIVHAMTLEEARNILKDDPYNKEAINVLKASSKINPDLIKITVTIASERVIDGKKETTILSQPSAGTQLIGEETGIKVTSKFTTEVPGYANVTTQKGDAGVILKFTPNMDGSDILLKGVVEIRKVQTMQSLEEQGAVAVQNSTIVQFSLKAHENTPIKLSPIAMPDGSNLLLTFNATTEKQNQGMSREEREQSRQE